MNTNSEHCQDAPTIGGDSLAVEPGAGEGRDEGFREGPGGADPHQLRGQEPIVPAAREKVAWTKSQTTKPIRMAVAGPGP